MANHPPRRFSLDRIKRLFWFSSATQYSSAIAAASERPDNDPTKFNLEGDNPLHVLVKQEHGDPGKKQKQLVTLLCQSYLFINLHNKHGMTALHLATQLGDIASMKTLLVFRADPNVLNWQYKTPLDMFESPPVLLRSQSSASLTPRPSHAHSECSRDIGEVLKLYGGINARHLGPNNAGSSSVDPPFNSSHDSVERDEGIKINLEPVAYIDQLAKRFYECESKINLQLAADTQPTSEDCLSLAREMRKVHVLRQGGSRVLTLDGGGMMCLIEVEILIEIEKRTGKKIVELFDWIVGTSGGSWVAAGLVHGHSIHSIRQFMYERIDKLWFSHRLGLAFNTAQLENDAKASFGDKLINSVTFPRLLIPAVDKSCTPLKLCFFNNCFDDEFSNQPVWKVLRYSGAAPMFYKELDGYTDGGVLANNPCEAALNRIHSFYKQRNERLPLSLVVSLGSGRDPPRTIGNIDCQDFLFFGSHWLYTHTTLSERTQNLSRLFAEAICRTEAITANCRSRCEELGIPFYRLSPQLQECVKLGETNILKLVDMLIATKRETLDGPELSELVELLLRYPAAKHRTLELLQQSHL